MKFTGIALLLSIIVCLENGYTLLKLLVQKIIIIKHYMSMKRNFKKSVLTCNIAKFPTFLEKRNSHFTLEKMYGLSLIQYFPVSK